MILITALYSTNGSRLSELELTTLGVRLNKDAYWITGLKLWLFELIFVGVSSIAEPLDTAPTNKTIDFVAVVVVKLKSAPVAVNPVNVESSCVVPALVNCINPPVLLILPLSVTTTASAE